MNKAEWDEPRIILTKSPGSETSLASFTSASGLHQGPFSLTEAKNEHRAFRSGLEILASKARHYEVGELLMRDNIRDELKMLAQKRLSINSLEKQMYLDMMSPEELVQNILLGPNLFPKNAKVSVNPLGSFLFTRDQQIITDQGIIFGLFKPEERRAETDLMKLAFKSLGFDVSKQVSGHTTLEGGDFIPAGDHAFLGLGTRTDDFAAMNLMTNDWVGYNELVLVIDPYKQQEEMHLDTFFNVFGKRKCIISEERIMSGHPKECYVVVFRKEEFGYRVNGDYLWCTNEKKVFNEKKSWPLRKYLQRKGYTIIPVSSELQKSHATNFLTIRENLVAGVDISAKKELQDFYLKHSDGSNQSFFPVRDPRGDKIDYEKIHDEYMEKLIKKGITYIPFKFNHINMLYGGPHCATQVVRGEAR